MPFYRFYLLTAADHIERRQEANCDDDARAVAAAAEIIGRYPAVEVWNEGRRIIKLAAKDIHPSGRQAAHAASLNPKTMRRVPYD
jgi:hypothetical protein